MADNQLIEVNQAGDIEGVNKLFTSSDFLGRVQLMTDKSDMVKEDKFPKNHWAYISGESTVDCGNDLVCIPLAFRAKAMRRTAEGTFETCYNVNDPLFAEIQSEAESDPTGGCMCGPSILIWVPGIVNGEGRFAELFLLSKSAKRNGTPIRDRIGRGVSLKPKFIKTPKFSWWSFETLACDTITPDQLPTPEELDKESKRFLNPPVQEKVEPAQQRER